MNRLISDEEELQEVFYNDDDQDPEAELDFSEDHIPEHEHGHIYESIEAVVGPAADEATIEIFPDEGSEDTLDRDFDEDLPESFYEEQAYGINRRQ